MRGTWTSVKGAHAYRSGCKQRFPCKVLCRVSKGVCRMTYLPPTITVAANLPEQPLLLLLLQLLASVLLLALPDGEVGLHGSGSGSGSPDCSRPLLLPQTLLPQTLPRP